VVMADQLWFCMGDGQTDRTSRASPVAAFFGLESTHFASSGSVRFPGNRDRRLSALTMLGGTAYVK
jgi:hypothetical protein